MNLNTFYDEGSNVNDYDPMEIEDHSRYFRSNGMIADTIIAISIAILPNFISLSSQSNLW